MFKKNNLFKVGAANIIAVVISVVVVGALTFATTNYFANKTRGASKDGIDRTKTNVTQHTQEAANGDILLPSHQGWVEGENNGGAGNNGCLHANNKITAEGRICEDCNANISQPSPFQFGALYAGFQDEEDEFITGSVRFNSNGSGTIYFTSATETNEISFPPNTYVFEGLNVYMLNSETNEYIMVGTVSPDGRSINDGNATYTIFNSNYMEDIYYNIYYYPLRADGVSYENIVVLDEKYAMFSFYDKDTLTGLSIIGKYTVAEQTKAFELEIPNLSIGKIFISADNSFIMPQNEIIHNKITNSQYYFEGNIVYSYDKTELLAVPQDLQNFAIREGCVSASDVAFYNSEIKNIYIPASLTKVSYACNFIDVQNVYYAGTEAQWNTIDGRDAFDGATIHYNQTKLP